MSNETRAVGRLSEMLRNMADQVDEAGSDLSIVQLLVAYRPEGGNDSQMIIASGLSSAHQRLALIQTAAAIANNLSTQMCTDFGIFEAPSEITDPTVS